MAASNAAMIKINFLEDPELATKLMKLPLDTSVSETIQQIVSRFKIPDGAYELLLGDAVLPEHSLLSDHGVAARSVLSFRSAPSAADPPSDGLSSPFEQWSAATVVAWVRAIDLGPAAQEAVKQFEENMLAGKDLLDISDAELKEDLGIKALGARKKILRELTRLREHGHFVPENSSSSTPPSSSSTPSSSTPLSSSSSSPLSAPSPSPTLSAPPPSAALPPKPPVGAGIRAQLESMQPRAPLPGPLSPKPSLLPTPAVAPPHDPNSPEDPSSVNSSSSPPAGPVAAMISTSKSRTVSRSQLAHLANVSAPSRPRAPSLVSAAAQVAAQNASAGANFGPSSQRPLGDVLGQSAVGPAPYLDEIRVAGTIMAEMRAAVESAQGRSPAGSSPAPAAAAAPAGSGKGKTQSTFGIGKVFNSGGGSSRASQVVSLAGAGSAGAIPLSIGLINAMLLAIQRSGGLQQEGIFRISGGSSAVRLVYEQMRESFAPDLTGCDPHDLSSAFKMYLRELAAPLIPYGCYANLISSVVGPGRINPEALTQALFLMPPENKAILRLLTSFLQLVVANQAVTKMNPKNLAIVFGPTLLRSEDPMAGLREAAQQTDIIQELIDKYTHYFDASSFDQLSKAIGELGSSMPASSAPPAARPGNPTPQPPKRGGMFGRK